MGAPVHVHMLHMPKSAPGSGYYGPTDTNLHAWLRVEGVEREQPRYPVEVVTGTVRQTRSRSFLDSNKFQLLESSYSYCCSS